MLAVDCARAAATTTRSTSPIRLATAAGRRQPDRYPALQWEFPNEDDFNSGTGDYRNMGETWGQPVITRVKLNVGRQHATAERASSAGWRS